MGEFFNVRPIVSVFVPYRKIKTELIKSTSGTNQEFVKLGKESTYEITNKQESNWLVRESSRSIYNYDFLKAFGQISGSEGFGGMPAKSDKSKCQLGRHVSFGLKGLFKCCTA